MCWERVRIEFPSTEACESHMCATRRAGKITSAFYPQYPQPVDNFVPQCFWHDTRDLSELYETLLCVGSTRRT